MTTSNETSTFVKKMAAPGKYIRLFLIFLSFVSDEKTRDRAVKAVEKFLSLQGEAMGYDEFLKLWKGFFYCFWLSDKSDGQQKLAEIISKFIHKLPVDNKNNPAESSAFIFMRTFWETMGREWPNLDHLRLNKYYYFMGRFLFESFTLIASNCTDDNEWSFDMVKALTAILSSVIFDFKNQAYPMSIRSYVIENYFAIVKSVRDVPFSAEATILVCEPIISAIAHCDNKVFFSQFSEALIQGILPGEEGEEVEDGMELESEIESESNEEVPLVEEGEELDEKDALETDFDEEVGEDEEEEEEFDLESEEEDDDEEEEEEEEDFEEDGEKDDEMASDYCDEDYVNSIFDYSKLGRFIFEMGSKDDVLVRNRRFLFDFSKIIEEINSGEVDCCGSNNCRDSEACH